jgi:hypothetical protein
MRYDELMSKLFGFSVPTYYNWKKENRPIINLIEQSFSVQQIENFLEFGNFLCRPELLINECNNKILKFIDMIGIATNTLRDLYGHYDVEDAEKFLDVLVYTTKNYEVGLDSYKPRYIKKYMQRYYDEYKDLYDVSSRDLQEYNCVIDDLEFDNNINFDSLMDNDFKNLVYYAMNYKIKYFDLVLIFYLKYVYFNQKEKINQIYNKIKPTYQDKRDNVYYNSILYYDNTFFKDEKNITLIFNYELFKELVLSN